MAARTLFLSVLIAIAAAMIPTLLADNDVHASEDWRAETMAETSVDAVAASPARVTSQPEPAESSDTETDEAAEPTPAMVVTADLGEDAPADRGVRTVVVAAAAPVPAETGDEPALESEPAPAAATVVAAPAEPAPAPVADASAEPVEAGAEAAASPITETPAATDPAVPAAPVAVAGYTIGDLAPQTPASSGQTSSGSSVNLGAAMLPEGVDVDPNSDMVEILVPSVGQGALFPAEIGPVDFSTDMVAIVITDEGMFPAGVDGDMSADMVELSAD